ncbi:uncharacterized protein VTP21DRAFT_10096 [Calcarisporiella thermophila]|uniref:uncharacterized protein n=1 Tax=Calcarisporiella thermophila TaxID=911321 RepID=UPI003742A5B0
MQLELNKDESIADKRPKAINQQQQQEESVDLAAVEQAKRHVEGGGLLSLSCLPSVDPTVVSSPIQPTSPPPQDPVLIPESPQSFASLASPSESSQIYDGSSQTILIQHSPILTDHATMDSASIARISCSPPSTIPIPPSNVMRSSSFIPLPISLPRSKTAPTAQVDHAERLEQVVRIASQPAITLPTDSLPTDTVDQVFSPPEEIGNSVPRPNLNVVETEQLPADLDTLPPSSPPEAIMEYFPILNAGNNAPAVGHVLDGKGIEEDNGADIANTRVAGPIDAHTTAIQEPKRSLRKRTQLQLHPYTVDKVKYYQLIGRTLPGSNSEEASVESHKRRYRGVFFDPDYVEAIEAGGTETAMQSKRRNARIKIKNSIYSATRRSLQRSDKVSRLRRPLPYTYGRNVRRQLIQRGRGVGRTSRSNGSDATLGANVFHRKRAEKRKKADAPQKDHRKRRRTLESNAEHRVDEEGQLVDSGDDELPNMSELLSGIPSTSAGGAQSYLSRHPTEYDSDGNTKSQPHVSSKSNRFQRKVRRILASSDLEPSSDEEELSDVQVREEESGELGARAANIRQLINSHYHQSHHKRITDVRQVNKKRLKGILPSSFTKVYQRQLREDALRRERTRREQLESRRRARFPSQRPSPPVEYPSAGPNDHPNGEEQRDPVDRVSETPMPENISAISPYPVYKDRPSSPPPLPPPLNLSLHLAGVNDVFTDEENEDNGEEEDREGSNGEIDDEGAYNSDLDWRAWPPLGSDPSSPEYAISDPGDLAYERDLINRMITRRPASPSSVQSRKRLRQTRLGIVQRARNRLGSSSAARGTLRTRAYGIGSRRSVAKSKRTTPNTTRQPRLKQSRLSYPKSFTRQEATNAIARLPPRSKPSGATSRPRSAGRNSSHAGSATSRLPSESNSSNSRWKFLRVENESHRAVNQSDWVRGLLQMMGREASHAQGQTRLAVHTASHDGEISKRRGNANERDSSATGPIRVQAVDNAHAAEERRRAHKQQLPPRSHKSSSGTSREFVVPPVSVDRRRLQRRSELNAQGVHIASSPAPDFHEHIPDPHEQRNGTLHPPPPALSTKSFAQVAADPAPISASAADANDDGSKEEEDWWPPDTTPLVNFGMERLPSGFSFTSDTYIGQGSLRHLLEFSASEHQEPPDTTAAQEFRVFGTPIQLQNNTREILRLMPPLFFQLATRLGELVEADMQITGHSHPQHADNITAILSECRAFFTFVSTCLAQIVPTMDVRERTIFLAVIGTEISTLLQKVSAFEKNLPQEIDAVRSGRALLMVRWHVTEWAYRSYAQNSIGGEGEGGGVEGEGEALSFEAQINDLVKYLIRLGSRSLRITLLGRFPPATTTIRDSLTQHDAVAGVWICLINLLNQRKLSKGGTDVVLPPEMKDFWTVFNRCFLEAFPAPGENGEAWRGSERGWEFLFSLLPLFQFNLDGVSFAEAAVPPNWELIEQLLAMNPLFARNDWLARSPSKTRRHVAAFDRHVRAVFIRCHELQTRWGWTPHASLVLRLYRFFERRKMCDLATEEESGSSFPLFFQHFNGTIPQTLSERDTCFHIFLKLMHLAVDQQCKQCLDAVSRGESDADRLRKGIHKFLSRLTPTHVMTINETSTAAGGKSPSTLHNTSIASPRYTSLANHYNISLLTAHTVPPEIKPRSVVQMKSFLRFEESDAVARRIALEAFALLGNVLQYHGDDVSPVVAHLDEQLTFLCAEFVREEIRRDMPVIAPIFLQRDPQQPPPPKHQQAPVQVFRNDAEREAWHEKQSQLLELIQACFGYLAKLASYSLRIPSTIYLSLVVKTILNPVQPFPPSARLCAIRYLRGLVRIHNASLKQNSLESQSGESNRDRPSSQSAACGVRASQLDPSEHDVEYDVEFDDFDYDAVELERYDGGYIAQQEQKSEEDRLFSRNLDAWVIDRLKELIATNHKPGWGYGERYGLTDELLLEAVECLVECTAITVEHRLRSWEDLMQLDEKSFSASAPHLPFGGTVASIVRHAVERRRRDQN